MTTLVWLRNDLRMRDNPALYDARRRGDVIVLYLLTPGQWRRHHLSDTRLAFILRTLAALRADLDRRGIPLEVLSVPTFREVPGAIVEAARSFGATRVSANRELPLDEARRDERTAAALAAGGIELELHDTVTIIPPGAVTKADGSAYTVFTPFRKQWLKRVDLSALEPLGLPAKQAPRAATTELPTEVLGVSSDYRKGLWPAGEDVARRRLARFLETRAARYADDRDRPSLDGTSGLSPYLAVGSISATRCLAAAIKANGGSLTGNDPGLAAWISELVWREFYHHIVAVFPRISMGYAFRPETENLAWRSDPEGFDRWCAGETGFPLVDAGMRQLAQTGWMHNRLRMLTAQFLTKHLLIDWREGERFFMRHLVDGDFAANNGGWQWSASTGTDAVPYFRIFNPIRQASRFDPDGAYVRRYVSELADVPVRAVLEPWRHLAPSVYPRPIVDHARARERAMAAFRAVAKSRR